MANRNAKDVQRFVDNISKEVGEKAYDPTEYATKEYVDETFEKKADVVDVVANPELSGDEADLTGLEVNGVKYAVPSGGGIETFVLDVESDGTGFDFANFENVIIPKYKNGEIIIICKSSVNTLYAGIVTSINDNGDGSYTVSNGESYGVIIDCINHTYETNRP